MAKANRSDYDVIEGLEAAEYIAEKAQHVHIRVKSISALVTQVRTFLKDNHNMCDKLMNVFFRPETYPDIKDSKAVDWLFVFHTLNFSLFNPKGTKQWRAGNTEGYFALGFAIKRAIDEKKPLWDPKYYTTLTQSELEYIFRSDDGETSIPLINERHRILREVGEVLLNKYQGTFVKCVKSCEYKADKLVNLLFDEFESYRDEAIYEGKKVRLHTKAISLVNDICACYKKKYKFGSKTMIMSTMFIECRTPIVLLHWNVLRYSKKLEKRFKNYSKPLEHGSREEIEIRGCSLVAANIMLDTIYYSIIKDVINYYKHKGVNRPLIEKNIQILIDNFLIGFLEDKIDKCLNQETFHYIRSVLY